MVGETMIKSDLHILMGKRKIKSILQLHNETGISRRALTNLYNDTFKAVDTETLNTLCTFFDCTLGELLKFVPEDKGQ